MNLQVKNEDNKSIQNDQSRESTDSTPNNFYDPILLILEF